MSPDPDHSQDTNEMVGLESELNLVDIHIESDNLAHNSNIEKAPLQPLSRNMDEEVILLHVWTLVTKKNVKHQRQMRTVKFQVTKLWFRKENKVRKGVV